MTAPSRRVPASVAVVAVALLATAVTLLVIALRPASEPRTLQERVRAVGMTLRCPACQDLSVADSPSPIARAMRAQIATDLTGGMSPQRIRAVFVGRYGDWILLSPPKSGLNMVVWLAPALLLIGGIGLAVFAVRRWTLSPEPGPERAGQGGEAAELSSGDRRLLERAMATVDEDAE